MGFDAIGDVSLAVMGLLLLCLVDVPAKVVIVGSFSVECAVQYVSVGGSIGGAFVLLFRGRVPIVTRAVPIAVRNAIFFGGACVVLAGDVSGVFVAASDLYRPGVFSLVAVASDPCVRVVVGWNVFICRLPDFIAYRHVVLDQVGSLVADGDFHGVYSKL